MRIDFYLHNDKENEILWAIQELKEIIMNTQADFDAAIAEVNDKLDAIGVDVAAEAEEIAAFIDAQPPEVDTSALAGVVDRLSALDDGIKGIFTTPTPVESAPPAE